MVLNEEEILRPVYDRSSIERTLQHLSANGIPLVDCHSKELLHRFQTESLMKINHFASMGEYMRHLHGQKSMFDVIVSIQDQEFPAHRHALACFSSYFADMFKKRDGKQTIPLKIKFRGVSPQAFGAFIEYVYSGGLCMDSENIGSYIVLSEFLDIPLMRRQCATFLDGVKLEQVISVLKNARDASNSNLFKFALSVLGKDVDAVMTSEPFLALDVSTLCVILNHDSLEVPTEQSVFNMALYWFAKDMGARRKFTKRVMGCIRFAYMNQRELFECHEKTDLLKECPEIVHLMLQASWCVYSYLYSYSYL